MAEGGQKEAELKAGRSEEQTRNSIERRHGEEAVTEKVTVMINLAADNGQRGAQRANTVHSVVILLCVYHYSLHSHCRMLGL